MVFLCIVVQTMLLEPCPLVSFYIARVPSYVAAISASHVPIVPRFCGRHTLVFHFLHCTWWLRHICCYRVLSWNLSAVLKVLSEPCFGPFESFSGNQFTYLYSWQIVEKIGLLKFLCCKIGFVSKSWFISLNVCFEVWLRLVETGLDSSYHYLLDWNQWRFCTLWHQIF